MPVPRSICRKPLAILLVTLLAGLSASCAPKNEGSIETATRAGNQTPCHLVLISLDTFRADHLRFDLTPRLASLAEESVRFDDFATAAPSTLASHTSLFTGLYPHRHGVASNGWIVPGSLDTLAEVLRRAGFHTAGVVGSFALLDRFDIDQGFDHWNQDFDQTVGVDEVDQSQRRADRVVDAALAHLDTYLDGPDGDGGSDAEDRLFLFVHLFDTHYPYDAPNDAPTSTDDALRAGPDLQWTDSEQVRSESVDGETPDELARRYAEEAAFVDAQVGRLVDELVRRGVLDDTLLVVTSDHGEALWQHGERWHATEVYETTTHGLFFARLPTRSPKSDAALVSGATGTVDVMPTLLRALGLPVPEGLDGEALDLRSPSLNDGGRLRFSQATGSHVAIPPNHAEMESADRWPNFPLPRAVRQGRWKLIQWPLDGREALFDLQADPSERRNLIASPPADADAEGLRRSLEAWAESADPLPSHFDRDFELDTRRQLCALGYVECPGEN